MRKKLYAVAVCTVFALAVSQAGAAIASIAVEEVSIEANLSNPVSGSFYVYFSAAGTNPDIQFFQTEVTIPSGTGVTITGVQEPTSPYPYALDGTGSSFITGYSATGARANDLAPSGDTLADLDGFMKVNYEVAAGAANGVVPITLTPYDVNTGNGSGIFDSSLNEISTTLDDGSITITPEPATMGFLALGGLAVLVRRRRR